jgi:hypothetical protein
MVFLPIEEPEASAVLKVSVFLDILLSLNKKFLISRQN